MTPAYPYPDADPQLVTSLKTAHFLSHSVPVENLPDYLRRCIQLTVRQRSEGWLACYASLGLPLVFWRRTSDPKDDWKGPREEGWPQRNYPPSVYRDGMQVGAKLGMEIAPGRFLWDADFDWAPGIAHAHRFLPTTFR